MVPAVRGREGLGCGSRRRPGPSASISLPVLHQSLLSRHHRPHTASFQGACHIFKCLVCYLQPSVLLEASSPSRRALLVARGEQIQRLHSAHFSPLPLSTCLPTPSSYPAISSGFQMLGVCISFGDVHRDRPHFAATSPPPPSLSVSDLFFNLSPEVLT